MLYHVASTSRRLFTGVTFSFVIQFRRCILHVLWLMVESQLNASLLPGALLTRQSFYGLVDTADMNYKSETGELDRDRSEQWTVALATPILA